MKEETENPNEAFDDFAKAAGQLGAATGRILDPTLLEMEVARRREQKRKSCITVVILALIFFALGAMFMQVLNCSREVKAEPEAVIANEQVPDLLPVEIDGAFGVIENDINYRYARARSISPEDIHQLRITVYGPSRFPATNNTARWIDGDPTTVQEGLDWANELGLDGICAASKGTPWYSRVRDEMPPILYVDGHGSYLCIDRMAAWVRGGIDLWVADPYPGGTYFAKNDIDVWELTDVQND